MRARSGAPWLRCTISGHDAHRPFTALAWLGLAAGVAMAARGLPDVDLHGPLHQLGVMDPLCGATRGVRLAFLGDLAGAWRYNPIAIVVAGGIIVLVVRAATGWISHHWLTITLTWSPRRWTVVAAVLLALEVNQQLHAQLLLTAANG